MLAKNAAEYCVNRGINKLNKKLIKVKFQE